MNDSVASCKTATKKRRATDADIEEALRACKAILTASCAWLAKNKGIQMRHQSMSARIAKSERLQKVREEVEYSTLDFAESKLLQLLDMGDKTAIIFYLKCKGKSRGYIERQELTGEDGSPIAVTTPEIKVVFNGGAEDEKEEG